MKRLIFITIIILIPSTVRAETRYVSEGQYASIQEAINDANNSDVIIVDPGTYYENINFLGKAVTVRSTDPNNTDIVASTIIDGSLPADPNKASTVTFNSGEGNDSILEGFTLTGGTGTWLAVAWRFHEVYWNRCGGGVICYNMSEPTIRKNIITDNSAGEGGGIYVYGDPVNPNSPSNPPVHLKPAISENTLTNNSAIIEHGFMPPDSNYSFEEHGDGGAIVCYQGVDASIKDNIIENNHAELYGGALHIRQWSNGIIENNQVLGNDSALGAGVHITYTSSPIVRANIIENNVAGGLGGGGVYIYYQSEPTIDRNYIAYNESSNGAGMAVFWESHALVSNNLIINNTKGAGIIVKGSSVTTIRNNTISGNGSSGLYFGNGAYPPDNKPLIQNNIITSNKAYGIYSSYNTLDINHNNIWNNISGDYSSAVGNLTGINGNISVNPSFISSDDFRLSAYSQCINAGDPNYLPVPDETDYFNGERLLGQYIDIGADETLPIWNKTANEYYYNIQEAVNNADEFDVIIVTIGKHTGDGNRDIELLGKALTIQSIDPNNTEIVAATIIDSQGSVYETHRGFHIRHGEDSNSIINGLTITGGGGKYEGGAIRCYNSSPTIINCIMKDNLSEGRGGAIYCGDGSHSYISNCLITNNIATRGYGGAIACFFDSSPLITNCIMSNNHAVGHGHHGGGVCCWQNSNAVVANCIVTGNTAGHRGGGLYAYWSDPTFINCTVIGNTGEQGGGVGSFREANPKVYNCIVRNNISPYGDQLALINTSSIWPGTNIPTSMTVSNSNIEGGQSAVYIQPYCNLIWQQGNVDVDPNFVNPGYWDNGAPADPNDDYFISGNYHLLPISDCIDAGENLLLHAAVKLNDIDFEERIFNTVVDMGADEVITNRADFNTDGIVDLIDLICFSEKWLNSDNILLYDLHQDNIIDFYDFDLFAEQWLWQGKWYTDTD